MKTVYMLTQMVRADLRERTRRYNFLITLGLMIFLAYAYVPARTAGYITLSVDGARGVYNAAWVGSLVAILTALLMPLVGFYLVKNAIARDIATGVGQIIATTPLRRPLYTVGKWLSNFTVLAIMAGVTALARPSRSSRSAKTASLTWSPYVAHAVDGAADFGAGGGAGAAV